MKAAILQGYPSAPRIFSQPVLRSKTRRSSDLITATVSNRIPQLLRRRPGAHLGTLAYQCGTMVPAWTPTSQLPTREHILLLEPMEEARLGTPWSGPAAGQMDDDTTAVLGTVYLAAVAKGEGKADSPILLLRGDYRRILGRPTVEGGTPCSGCSLGMSHKGRKCSGCSPYRLGATREKTQKYYALKPSRSWGL